MGIVVAAVIVATVTLQPVGPARATYYSGGMWSAHFPIRSYSYNSTWQVPLDRALTNWYNTPTAAWIEKSASAPSWLEASSFPDTWFGLYTPYGSGSGRYFRIQMNSRTLSASSGGNFANWVTSSFTHELGHALSLNDNPPVAASASLMRHDRNRATLTTPQQYDINDVNNFYSSR
ncbi:hypothetical protein AB0J90_20580 [Micromonospora sp. NPDC049523]|uniref:hypothetical protein n=1 Tax=Micromonospora sp. NPDC049523 TaxID=3155921 RepID=UPI00342F82C6